MGRLRLGWTHWVRSGFAWFLILAYPAWRVVEAASGAAWLMSFLPRGLVDFAASYGWILAMATGFFMLHRLNSAGRELYELQTRLVEFLRRLGEFDQKAQHRMTIASAEEVREPRGKMLSALIGAILAMENAHSDPARYHKMLKRAMETLKENHPEALTVGDANVYDALRIAVDIASKKKSPPPESGL